MFERHKKNISAGYNAIFYVFMKYFTLQQFFIYE